MGTKCSCNVERMDGRFTAMYSAFGPESIAPEKLMRVPILQVLHGLRSERLMVEQLGYNLLYTLVRRTRDRRPGVG